MNSSSDMQLLVCDIFAGINVRLLEGEAAEIVSRTDERLIPSPKA
jgi:hypothetical protein